MAKDRKAVPTTLFENSETADIETSSDDYARRFEGEIGRWFLKVQEEATLAMLFPYKNAKVLDVGGGHGQLTEAFLKQGFGVTIVGSAMSCKKRVEKFIHGVQCSFVTGNLIDLPFPDRMFDVVVSYRLLPHVTRWRQLIFELCRVAKRAVIVDFPEVKSVNVIAPLLFGWKKGIEQNTRPFTCFRQSELLQEFRHYGFCLADRYPEFFLPMVLHRALKTLALSSSMEWFFRQLKLTQKLGSPVILKLVRQDR